ncbi:Toll/interleukin-1 receptor domain-containing protein [Tanacetum coccineum]
MSRKLNHEEMHLWVQVTFLDGNPRTLQAGNFLFVPVHKAGVIQKIVDAISDKLLSSNSDIDEELVGMTNRVKDWISRLEIGTGGVRMVGIWGVGSGEEVLKKEVKVQSVEQGKRMIQSSLCHSNVLILLDDVDDPKQLEALAGSHKWFGDGSRIIITTRDEHVLKTRKVDHISPVTLLSQDEGIWLFRKYAYNKEEPLKDYGIFSLRVVSYDGGLPLTLKVLGSFLYDKDEKEWRSTLDRLEQIPKSEIVEKLKISYDGLKKVDKELFLDIACFFRGESKDNIMELLEACSFHHDIRLGLICMIWMVGLICMIWYKRWDTILLEGNILTILKNIPEFGKEKKSKTYVLGIQRWSEVPTSLSNELRYIEWDYYPAYRFPNSFQPMNLGVLKMENGLQTELWKGWKHLPFLKVLEIKWMKNLVSTPDFDGLPSLQKLTIDECDELEEIHPSLGNHKTLKYLKVHCYLKKFPKIDYMKKLENLQISSYYDDFEILEIQLDMENLNHLSKLDFNLSKLTMLVHLDLSNCTWIEKLPEFPSSLVTFNTDYCDRLTDIGEVNRNYKWLCQVSVIGGGNLNDGDRLLQSILQRKAIENHSMVLQLEGLQIPREFRPRLRAGRKCTLQLPENWCNDFCGFLICAVLDTNMSHRNIIMKLVRGGSIGIDTQDSADWKESNDVDSQDDVDLEESDDVDWEESVYDKRI